MKPIYLKVICAAVCAAVPGIVVAIAPKWWAVAAAAGAGGFAGWKYIAAWEVQKALDAAKGAAGSVGIKV